MPLGGILGTSWVFVGGLGSILELLRCAWGHLGGLGASWDVLGATLGVEGWTWAHLGPS